VRCVTVQVAVTFARIAFATTVELECAGPPLGPGPDQGGARNYLTGTFHSLAWAETSQHAPVILATHGGLGLLLVAGSVWLAARAVAAAGGQSPGPPSRARCASSEPTSTAAASSTVPGVVERDAGEQVHIHSDSELGKEREQQADSPAPGGEIPAVLLGACRARPRSHSTGWCGWLAVAGAGACSSAVGGAGRAGPGVAARRRRSPQGLCWPGGSMPWPRYQAVSSAMVCARGR
jgi:hypothetical protein